MGFWAWVDPILAVATLVVAVLILVLARRSIAAVALAVYLAAWGAANLQVTVLSQMGADIAFVMKLGWSLNLVSWAGVLAFAIVYPYVHVTPGRRAALVATIGLAAMGVLAIMTGPDDAWFDAGTGESRMAPVAGAILGTFGEAVPMAILGWRWLSREADAYRTQLAWGILPVAWWMLHDLLGHTMYPWLLDGGPAPDLGHPLLNLFIWLQTVGALFTLALGAVALGRVVRGQGAGDDRALGFGILYMIPLTLVQMVAPGPGGPGLSTHFLLDYAVVPIAVYGVLRHRVVDIDLKLKHGVKRSTVAVAFLGIFVVVTTITQEFLTDAMGWLAGGLAAGLLVFALVPIQRMAERISDAAFPHASTEPGYLTYRRYQIYRVALEGTLHDGIHTPAEASALGRLREELGITIDDHTALEAEVRGRVAVAGV